MTSDGRKGLVFSYNVCNLPREVTSGASGSLTYTYLSDGTKVSAIKSDDRFHVHQDGPLVREGPCGECEDGGGHHSGT